MSNLPVLSYAGIDRTLRHLRFAVTRQRGSHVSYRNADGRGTTVPNHGGRDNAPALPRTILREAGIDRDEFERALRR